MQGELLEAFGVDLGLDLLKVEPLLALRPVVDSNATKRFCISLHFEITPTRSLKQLVTKLGKLIKLFPSQAPFGGE